MDDLSDLETEVSNYFRKGHQHDCGPSRNGVQMTLVVMIIDVKNVDPKNIKLKNAFFTKENTL